MYNKRTRIVQSTDPKICELDFSLDAFRRQKVFVDDDAYVQLIRRLLVMRKGTYPTVPDMGVDIARYRFSDIDTLIAGDLKNAIIDQVNTYIPSLPLEDVNIYKLKYQNGYVLYIDISFTSLQVNKVTYAFYQRKYNIVSTSVTIEKPKLINQQEG